MQTIGRFAPSPSGRIHLGNIFCCLLAWLSARQKGGRVVLRIEDLDTARCPRRYALQLQEDLRWLGLDWDEGPEAGGSVDLMNRAGAQLSTGRPWRGSRPRGWCTPAFVPGQSSTLPAPHTGRTVRLFTPALAAA